MAKLAQLPLPMRSVMWPSKACFRDEDIDNAQRAPCATGIAVPPSFVPARQVRGSPGLPHLMSHVHHVGAASARGIAEEASHLSRQARLARLEGGGLWDVTLAAPATDLSLPPGSAPLLVLVLRHSLPVGFPRASAGRPHRVILDAGPRGGLTSR